MAVIIYKSMEQISSELPPVQKDDQAKEPIPQPAETQYSGVNSEKQFSQAIEKATTGQAPVQPQDQSSQPQQAQQPDLSTQNNAPLPQGTPAPTAVPQIADDTDLIEKEWVLKAKDIVARTRQDPYMQNKAVELMKADYMKKRYNKEIKLTDD